jgi:glycosyltransferase involved in cell wall biosynthesis
VADIQFYVFILDKDYENIYFQSENFIKVKASYQWHSFAEQINFAALLYKYDLDLMHFTYFGHPILYKRKFISTIHDSILLQYKTGKASTKNRLIYELKHRAFQLTIHNQVRNSAAIITPSKTVKHDLIRYYGEQYSDKIYPIYEGVDYELQIAHENKELYKQFTKPFFLYVGNFYPHKNVERLIEAFSQLDEDVRLILRGPNDFFSKNIHQLIKELGIEKKVIFYHRYSHEDMAFFYKHAMALVHPSFSEGFGLPLVEAMYFHCPIIASNISVFKELLGNNYVSFNPENVTELSAKLREVKTRKEYDYDKKISEYSFEQMSKKTLEIYRNNV